MAASYRRESFFLKKLIVSIIISIVVILNISAVKAAGLNQAAIFDTAKLSSGIVSVSCNAGAGSKLKVIVEKNGRKIIYDLKNNGTNESFPLQMGDGSYKVSVLKNIEGNKYQYISTENVKLDLTDDNLVYLASVQNINWNYSMSAIKKAEELTKGLTTDSQKINAIYTYMVSSITYDYDKLSKLSYDYLPNIDIIVSSGKGLCYDFASTFAAMLRSQGIPTKLLKGYSVNVSGYHAWNEVYNSETGKWMTVDSTYDSQMKAAGAAYSFEKSEKDYTEVYEY